jgi:integrase
MQVRGELVVKGPKTNSGVRTIPLADWLIADLRLGIEKRSSFDPQSTHRIFTTITGKPLADHTLWKIIDRSRRTAGLPPFRPYDLRHSHASLLIELGAHPKAISERMGHSEIGVTMNVYGHLFQGAQGKLTNDLSGLVERTRKPTAPDESDT